MSNEIACGDCGMLVDAGEYHPYAACVMFKATHNSTLVRDNLAAVQRHGFSTMVPAARPEPQGEAVAYRCMPISGQRYTYTEDPVVAHLWHASVGRTVEKLYTRPTPAECYKAITVQQIDEAIAALSSAKHSASGWDECIALLRAMLPAAPEVTP